MMELICCDECGADSRPMGVIGINVELSKSHWCQSCYNSKVEKTSYYFCSETCFLTYIKKVVLGEAEFKFKRYDKAHL